MKPLLDIQNLQLSFNTYRGLSHILHGIDLFINEGERVALVGESGSGKSVTARLVLGLLQEARATKVSGHIMFDGQDINQQSANKRAQLRGRDMSMIFQDPTSSLNPTFPICDQFHDVMKRRQTNISRTQSFQAAYQLLEQVFIPDPERALHSYNFQLSGGMNQRVMIAMALANRPKLLLADEPGTALDVTVQAQTLSLMHDLVSEHNTAVLFISHNLGVVREFADRLYVIYKGRIVEEGPTKAIFDNPSHAYTKALLDAVPRITGGGLPELADVNEAYFAPKFTHGAG